MKNEFKIHPFVLTELIVGVLMLAYVFKITYTQPWNPILNGMLAISYIMFSLMFIDGVYNLKEDYLKIRSYNKRRLKK